MTRISSLLFATTLAILPLSAFAETGITPKVLAPTGIAPAGIAPMGITLAKTATPASVTGAPKVTAPAVEKTAAEKMGTDRTGTDKMTSEKAVTATQPTKPEMKTEAAGIRPVAHPTNTDRPHHAKVNVHPKTAEPVKS